MLRKRIVGGRASLLGCALLVVVACGSGEVGGGSDGDAGARANTDGGPSWDTASGGSAPKNGTGTGGTDGARRTADGVDAGSNDATEPGVGGASEEPEVLELPLGWTPSDLSPLAWYVASSAKYTADTTETTWHNNVANGPDLKQANGWSPQLVSAPWSSAHSSLWFNGAKVMTTAPWTGAPIGTNAGFTVLAVLRSELPQNAGIASWWSEWGDGVWANLRDTSGLTMLDYHRLDDATFTQMFAGNRDLGTAPHVVAWRFSPSTKIATVMVDGVLTASRAQPPVGNITSMPLLVGARSTLPTGLFRGHISELVIVGTDIPDEQLQYYNEYASTAWNLPTPNIQGPCIKADGSHSPANIRCDDGNPETFGDHCSAGTCAGTVPAAGSPRELAPVAWYRAAESEVVITSTGVSTWYDRSPEQRDLLNGYAWQPPFIANGWPGNKPTVRFLGSNTLKRTGWTGPPGGTESAFTVLAVLKTGTSQTTGGVVAWWNPNAYGQAAVKIKATAAVNSLNLFRHDDMAVVRDYSGDIDLGSANHVAAWRYQNGTAKLTVDGVTQTQTQLPLGPIPPDWFLMGIASGFGGLFNGDISELAVIPRSVSDAELARFNAYAKVEWDGFTLCTQNCAGAAYGAADGCGGTCGCDPNAPFDAPVPAFTGTMNADGLTFSADGLTAYISGIGTGGYDLFKATRTATTAFGTPVPVTTINTSQNERAPSLSADGLTLYFTAPNNAGDIAKAVRATTNDPFGSVQVFAPPLNSTNGGVSDQDPYWWGSQTLLFASERPSGAHREVYYTTLTGSTFSEPQKVVSVDVNSTYEDFRPVLTGDGLTLFFASKRPGIGNDTGGDVWVAKRPSTTPPFTQPFAAAANLWTVNSSGNEFPVYVTPDGCSLYFASNEETGFGSTENYRLYQATRPAAAPTQVTVTLNVVGQGKVVYGTLNCGAGTPGACTASGPPNTPFAVTATGGQATWIGSCTANGGQPSSDGIIVLAQGGVCNVTFATAPPVGPNGPCTTSIQCAQGLQCTNGTCRCAPGAACGEFGNPCGSDSACQSEFLCVNGTCRPPECLENPVVLGCGSPNSRCGQCTKNPLCESNADCPAGLVCPENNGWRYMVGDRRVCEDPRCLTEPEVLGCGLPTSPCGLCPRCIPDCEDKQCGDTNLDDGCGGQCTGLCPPGTPEGCNANTDCQPGNVCLPVDLGCLGITCLQTCRPADPCLKANLAPPDCGSPAAVCGPSCRPSEQPEGLCVDRVCGSDPVDGVSCGTCATGEFCTRAGRCARTAPDEPVVVPPGRTVTPAPSPPAVPVGTIAGQFVVTDRGSASYRMPLVVPPGRAGLEPALALRYTSGSENGPLGLGFSLDGLSVITACGRTYAEDGVSAAPNRFEPSQGDAYCMDGQRLIPVGLAPEGYEFRTSIDGFTKIILVPGEANYRFIAHTKDGRVLTYGGLSTTALVRLAPGLGSFPTYALSKVADRSGNFMRITYEQVPAIVDSPLVTGELLPRAITYTGHGNADGDREVFFDYEERSDELAGWRPGGLPLQRTKRMKSIDVRARGQLVRRYDIRYDPLLGQSRIKSVQEATSALPCDSPLAICKPATTFEYYDETGFAPGVVIDSPDTFGLFAPGHQATPFGLVHKWSPEVGSGTRQPQLGLSATEEPRTDRVSSFSGTGIEAPTSPIPYEAGLALSIGSVAYSNPWLSAASVAIGIINDVFGEDAEGPSYRAFDYGPIFLDAEPIQPAFVTSNIPRRYVVVGPTGGEKVVDATSGSPRRAWLIDVDGDGVQDNLYCEPTPSNPFPNLSYKLASAATVPANTHPAAPVGASAAEATGSVTPIFSNTCGCATAGILGCARPTSMALDVDGDGTRNLIVFDDNKHWAALDFTTGTPVWRTDWFAAMDGVISPATHYLLPADVNGDGLRDIVALAGRTYDYDPLEGSVETTRLSYVALSTGKGFDVRVLDTAPNAENDRIAPKQSSFIVDLDHDGKEEVLEPGPEPDPAPGVCTGGWQGALTRDCALAPRPWFVRKIVGSRISREPVPSLVARLGATGDFDGDGNLDVLALGPDKTKMTLHRGTGRRDGFLKSVTDGFGRRVDVNYDNKDQQGGLVFTSGSPSASNPPADPSCRWPYRCGERIDSVLVSSHDESYYLAQQRTPQNLTLTRRTRYHYKGSRTDVAGYGWLGFWERTITTEDGDGIPIGETTLRYQPPDAWNPQSSSVPYVHTRTGLVQQQIATGPQTTSAFSNSTERLISETVFDWQPRLSTKDRPFPFLEGTIRTVRAAQGASTTSEPLYRQTIDYGGDAFGNVTSTLTLEEDLTSNGTTVFASQTSSQVTRIFNPTPTEINDWLVGLVKTETVAATPRCTSAGECAGETRTRTTTFQYVPHTALLLSTNRQPGDPALARLTQYQHADAYGNVTGVITTDSQGSRRETQVVFDARGLFPNTMTEVGEGHSHTTQVRYDDRFGSETISADPNGIDQTTSYDAFGNERHYRGKGGERVTDYLPSDRFNVSGITAFTLPIISAYRVNVAVSNGARTETHYNPHGQVVRQVSAGYEGQPVFEEFVYDRRRRVQIRTRPHLETHVSQGAGSYAYDALDRVLVETRPDGGFTSHDYGLVRFATGMPNFNASGAVYASRSNVRTTTVANAPMLQTVQLNDRNEKVMRVLDPLGAPTDYAYGPFGELRRIQDPAARVITQVFDAWSRSTSTTDLARGGMETRTYNGLDEVVHTTDAANRSRDIFYDDFGRTTHFDDHVNGQIQTTHWTYDGDGSRPNEVGRLVEKVSPTGQLTTFRYEAPLATRNRGLLNRITRHVVDPSDPAVTRDLTTDYTFENSDISARLERVDYPQAFGSRVSVKNTEDGFGHIVKVADASDATGNTIHWQFQSAYEGYRVASERVGMARCGAPVGSPPAGSLTQRQYDDKNGTPETIVTTCAGTTLQSLGYDHDLAGRTVLRSDSHGRTESFRYDALSRPTHINDIEHYQYDPLGRGRLDSLRSDAGTNAYGYNSQGRDWIQSAGPLAYTQDGVGNVQNRTTGGVTQTFTYTGFDLPSRVATPTNVVDIAYDADRERAVKKTATATTFYAGDHHQEIANSAGSSARSMIYVAGRPIAQVTKASGGASTVRYLYSDMLGSIHTITDANGAVESRRDFGPFGEQRNTSADLSSVPYGFTGHEEDPELGLVNMKSRLYDSRLGQFLQADPVVRDGVGQGLNRYAYVNNSPLNFVDPKGESLKSVGRDLVDLAGRVAEATALAVAGGYLGYNFGQGPTMSAQMQGMHGAMNGAFAGWRHVYSLDFTGFGSFFLDSTRGITGTFVGNHLNIWNTATGATYSNYLSERKNRQVFHKGFPYSEDYAHTQGNVVSNLRHRNGRLLNHETEHVWQNRYFGAFYQSTYLGWTLFYGGEAILVGLAGGHFDFDDVKAAGYMTNPWEQHAYCSNNPDAKSGKGSRGFPLCGSLPGAPPQP